MAEKQYTETEIIKELAKCKKSFPYFCSNHVKVYNPEEGNVLFKLYEFQEKKVFPAFEKEKFVILKKFRQGGLSTLATIYSLWKILFFNDQRVFMISKTDRESTNLISMIRLTWGYLPEWIKCKTTEFNQHIIALENGSYVRCGTPQMGRSYSGQLIIIDEAAHIERMDEIWKAIFPVISAAGEKGKAFVISTVNGLGNWYSDTYHDARNGLNDFHIIDLDYTEHPKYNNEIYVKRMKKQLGEKGFAQEVLGEFISSNDTFISAKTLVRISNEVNSYTIEHKTHNDKLWIWERPSRGKSYAICADWSEGLGGNNDYQAFHVLDFTNLEQVAEFYDNEIKAEEYSKILHETAKYYNNAFLIMEGGGYGKAILEMLWYQLGYDNIYFDKSSVNARRTQMGIRVNKMNRGLIQSALATAIEGEYIKIKSARILHELESFIYNTSKKRAEHRNGRHDDLIFALSYGLYVRNLMEKQMPVIGDEDEDFKKTFDPEYEKALKELGIAENNEEEYEKNNSSEEDLYLKRRVSDEDEDEESMLREFGWSSATALDDDEGF
jgi:hypothetical protein